MGRTLLAAIIASTCLLPNLSQAQTSSRGRSIAPPPPSAPRGSAPGQGRQNPPPPAGQQPLPPGVPLVPPAPPSALDRADVFRATPRTYEPRFENRARPGFPGGVGGLLIADPFGYYLGQPESTAPQLDRYMRQADATGYLRLDVEPGSAQVFVDGLYAGTVADFRGSGQALDAGPHRIEIRADGFENQSVELRIRANDTLSYRGTLTRREQRPEPPVAAAAPKTFYVIPRCYAGTSRPTKEQLPSGCRIEDLRTIPPVLAPGARP
jgi:hypothetical protein